MAALNAIVCEALLAEAFQHLPTSARSASATPHVVEAAAVRELQAAHAALGTVREEAATVGRQLLPLRSAAELATLLQAELLYPPGTPKRSNKVLVELRTHGVAMPSEFELDLLLSRLHAHDDWNRALRSMTVPSEQRCVLVPPVTECVIRVVGVVRVALPKVVRPRSPAGLLRAHALALLLGAAHSERRQLRGSQRLVPHVGLPDHVSTESSVFETDSEVPESGAEKKIMAAGESGVRSPESGVRSPDRSGVRSPESGVQTQTGESECAVQTPSPEPRILSPGTPKKRLSLVQSPLSRNQ